MEKSQQVIKKEMPSTQKETRKRNSTNSIIKIIVGLLSVLSVCLISLCGLAFIFSSRGNPQSPIFTPVAQLPSEQVVAQTTNTEQQQTQALYTPTLPPRRERASTFTPTSFIFKLQTLVAQTPIVYSTSTPFIYVPPVYVAPTNPPLALATQSNNDNCDSSYPTVCINGNPRYVCKELRKKGIYHFQALPPDPLKYDKDGDGIGCD